MKTKPDMTAAQVVATIKATGMSRLEFAEYVGCGTSQLFKYEKEGLPPKSNKLVRANILKLAIQHGVLAENAARRKNVEKLAKGEKTVQPAQHRAPESDDE